MSGEPWAGGQGTVARPSVGCLDGGLAKARLLRDGGLLDANRIFNEKDIKFSPPVAFRRCQHLSGIGQQGKLGEVVCIPAVSRLEDHTKITGPSAFRDLLNIVLKRLLEVSASYASLREAFASFNTGLRTERCGSGPSIADIEEELTAEISQWGASLGISIDPVDPEDIVKGLIHPQVFDTCLSEPLDPRSCGQGFQRHLIFTLIRLPARYSSTPSAASPREFSPRLVWILFEEPEAFLHPPQIEILDARLRTLSQDPGNAVLISTHSPQFVSCSIEDLPCLARIRREGAASRVAQVSAEQLDDLFRVNREELTEWQAAGMQINVDDLSMDMEAAKLALWLNPLRCHSFFAEKVLLVEGATEQAVIGYLLRQTALSARSRGVFVMDAMGKLNMHSFMNLFRLLRIHHAVLYDQDGGRHRAVQDTIRGSTNQLTLGTDYFPQDIDAELGIARADADRRKPRHAMRQIRRGSVDPSRLAALSEMVAAVLGIELPTQRGPSGSAGAGRGHPPTADESRHDLV